MLQNFNQRDQTSIFWYIWCSDKSSLKIAIHAEDPLYSRICIRAKSEFLRIKIKENHLNPQKLCRVLCDVLHRLPAKFLPCMTPSTSGREIFTDKIEKIHPGLSGHPHDLNSQCLT